MTVTTLGREAASNSPVRSWSLQPFLHRADPHYARSKFAGKLLMRSLLPSKAVSTVSQLFSTIFARIFCYTTTRFTPIAPFQDTTARIRLDCWSTVHFFQFSLFRGGFCCCKPFWTSRTNSPMMTYCNRKENHASSEVFQYQTEPYCWTASLPLDFDPSWDQSNLSLSFEEFSLATSPDTISECTSLTSDSGCSEMVNHPWSPTASSVDYSRGPLMDHSTFSQSPGDGWHLNGVHDSVHAQDTAAWLNATETPVELGLSRAPSYDSQSTRTLNSFSEPDTCFLPAGVELPLTFEPYVHGSYVYTSPDIPQDYGFPCSFDPSGAGVACASSNAVELYPGSSPVFFPHGGQAAYSRHVVIPQGQPMRAILPRTEPTVIPTQPAFGPQRILRPCVPGSRQSQSSAGHVSNVNGLPHGATPGTLLHGTSSGHASLNITSGGIPLPPSIMDPTAEDFSAFIQVDQDDQSSLEGASKRFYKRNGYVSGPKVMLRDATHVPVETKPSLSDLELDVNKPLDTDPDKFATVGLPNESDEGRHRTHPDYSKPAHPDGMYRCPYKAKENCSHKPTKLKCNYDKYIDSHVKPFRCKLEACSKQEFSSTACLLRHEREAHGMHGHGDRPHLCYYSGCERANPGNGFPRRYNLFDHMKRVHDYKEDAVDSIGSPILGGETQKKIKGAKRKPSSPLSSEPAVQRQKTMASPQEQCQAAYYQAHPYWPRQEHRTSHYGMSAH